MQHQRGVKSRCMKLLLNRLRQIDAQLDLPPLRYPVLGSDRDREKVRAGCLNELHRLVGMRVEGIVRSDLILHAADLAELGLDENSTPFGHPDDLRARPDVRFERLRRRVDHDRRDEALLDGYLDQRQLLRGEVVEVDEDADRPVRREDLDEAGQGAQPGQLVSPAGVLGRPWADLDEQVRLRVRVRVQEPDERVGFGDVVRHVGISAALSPTVCFLQCVSSEKRHGAAPPKASGTKTWVVYSLREGGQILRERGGQQVRRVP